MDFYGQNDIPLGSFLTKYCFRESYVCPSKSCDTPMVDRSVPLLVEMYRLSHGDFRDFNRHGDPCFDFINYYWVADYVCLEALLCP